MTITHQVHTSTGRINNFVSAKAAHAFASSLRGEGRKTVGRLYAATADRDASFSPIASYFDTQAEADGFAVEMRQSEGMGF